MAVEIHADTAALAARAADLFWTVMSTAVRSKGRFTVALSGGDTPRATYADVARRASGTAASWEDVHIFWGDERCVPATDERSNEHMARTALLSRVPIPEAQIHPMRCAGDAAAAAKMYEGQLRAQLGTRPRFDLVLLGLGEDGHTASLFPTSALLSVTEEWVGVAQRPGEGFARLTLTLPVINESACVMFLVEGATKAEALRRAIAGDRSIPASLVRPAGDLYWLVDAPAARLLEGAR